MRMLLVRLLNRLAYFAPGGYSFRPQAHRWRGVRIGQHVWISSYVYLDELYPEAISIGDRCTIGLRTSIFTHFHWGPRMSVNGCREVVIEDDVFVGPHSVILPGVRIGEGAVIKAGTVVTTNVPAHTFWGPPPSGPLGSVTVPLTPENSYAAFLQGLRPFGDNGHAPGGLCLLPKDDGRQHGQDPRVKPGRPSQT